MVCKFDLDGGGPSIGFEKLLSVPNHAMGMLFGAIGMQDLPKKSSRIELTSNDNEGKVPQVPDKIEIIDWNFNIDIKTEETLVGLAASYSYSFTRLKDSTWYIRVESGYGQGCDTHKKAVKHSINLSYQF